MPGARLNGVPNSKENVYLKALQEKISAKQCLVCQKKYLSEDCPYLSWVGVGGGLHRLPRAPVSGRQAKATPAVLFHNTLFKRNTE